MRPDLKPPQTRRAKRAGRQRNRRPADRFCIGPHRRAADPLAGQELAAVASLNASR